MKKKLPKFDKYAILDTDRETFKVKSVSLSFVDFNHVLFVTAKELSDMEYKEIGIYIEATYDIM